MTLSDIGVGTVGGQDWTYKLGAPFGFGYNGSVKPETVFGMPFDTTQEDVYGVDSQYLRDEFHKYWTFDKPVDLENVVRDNYPITPIKSYKLAFEKNGNPNEDGSYALMAYDGKIVGQATFNDIIVLNEDGSEKTNFKLANVWRSIDSWVSIYRDGDETVTMGIENYNDLNSFYSAGIPLFYKDDPNNRIQEYLVSDDPDPTHFGGVFSEGKTQKPIDPDSSGSAVEGLFEDPGFDLAYGPMRGVVLDDENLNKLADKIGAGWYADNIGNAIISLKLIRLPGEINTTTDVNIGIIPMTKSWWGIGIDTPEVQGKYIRKQFQSFSFGQYTIEEKYNSFLDYTNTSVSLYLPFSGLHQLEPKTIIGSTIKVDCSIDLLTGSIIWFVRVVRDGVSQALYEWNGNCSMEMVLSAIDYAQKVTQHLTGVASITSSAIIGASGMSKMAGGNLQGGKSLIEGGKSFVSGAIDLYKSQHNNYINVGNISSNFGWSGIMYPFLVFSRTKTAYPSNYDENIGKPSMKNAKLGDLSGYTKVAEIHLDNMVCLEDERLELLRLLKDGIIL